MRVVAAGDPSSVTGVLDAGLERAGRRARRRVSARVRAPLRRRAVRRAIATNARLVAVKSREELFDLINRFAPAYLCLQVRDAWSYVERITTAGTILIGDSTPLVSGEYLAGTNAIAPAGGTARFASCLSLADFTRSVSAVENSAKRLAADAGVLAALAERDGFPHHAQTARMRQDR